MTRLPPMLYFVVAACGFNSNGLATSTNGSGTLDTASDTSGSETGNTTQSTTTSMTGTSASTTMPSTTVSDETGPATTMPGTTEDPTAPTTSDATLDPTDTASSSSAGTNATSSEGGSSSDGGLPGEPYYSDCEDMTDCGSGECYVYVDGNSNPLAHVCYIPCMGMPCPAAGGGSATPYCNMLDRCVLDCESGTCPDGMECYQLDGGAFRCSWPD